MNLQSVVDMATEFPNHTNVYLKMTAGKVELILPDERVPLSFDGWSADDNEGYSLFSYFTVSGEYLGPDQHGVHPLFSVEEVSP